LTFAFVVLERISKTATAASVLVILAALLALHTDLTLALCVTAALAFAAGALLGHLRGQPVQTACVLAAPLAPALLRLATGREGPVLDFIWMAGLSGALLRSVPWTRWVLPAKWSPLIGGWSLALALAWPVLAGREIAFDLSLLRDTGAINSWAMWPAAQTVDWILYWVLTQLLGVLWLDWVAGQFARSPQRFPRVGHALWIGATIASVVAVVQGTIDLTFLSTPFWASRGRATGTMLDANGYAVCAALAAPCAFLALRWAGGAPLVRDSTTLAWVVLATNCAGVWMSGSRTALLCAVGGLAGLAIDYRKAGATASEPRPWLAPALVAAVVAILVLIGGAIGPLQRLAQIPNVAELWNRGPYGPIAMQMVREYPLTGVGAGTFHFLAPDYWRLRSNNRLATDNAQNWWRHQAAELGLFGGALILIWSALVAWLVLAGGWPRGPSSASVRGMLIGLGLISLLGMPTQVPIVLLWFFFLVAWMTVLVPQAAAQTPARRAYWIAAAALAFAYAAGHLLLARSSLAVDERARRAERGYFVGAYAPEPFERANEFRWTTGQSHIVLPARTRWLVVRMWAAHPDIAKAPVHVRLSNRCGVLWQETLQSFMPVTIGIILAENERSFDASLAVSRTWQPSAFGDPDGRHLGVGVVTDFVASAEVARSQMYTLRRPTCAD
jgi:hypothetical protein